MVADTVSPSDLIDFLKNLLTELEAGRTVKAALDVQALIFTLQRQAVEPRDTSVHAPAEAQSGMESVGT